MKKLCVLLVIMMSASVASALDLTLTFLKKDGKPADVKSINAHSRDGKLLARTQESRNGVVKFDLPDDACLSSVKISYRYFSINPYGGATRWVSKSKWIGRPSLKRENKVTIKIP